MTASTEPQPDGVNLEEVRILRLQPGDTIVLTAEYHVTQQEADDIRLKLMARFPGHEAIVGPGLELSVARGGGLMSVSNEQARPLTLDRVARTMDATIFGVPVGVLGEDGDQGYVCITKDRRRAIAAACAFYRTEGNGRARQVDVKDLEWAHVFDHCGCGPHEVEDGDHSGCDCDHPRLPPCSPDAWWWTWETVTADAVDAIAMIRIEVTD